MAPDTLDSSILAQFVYECQLGLFTTPIVFYWHAFIQISNTMFGSNQFCSYSQLNVYNKMHIHIIGLYICILNTSNIIIVIILLILDIVINLIVWSGGHVNLIVLRLIVAHWCGSMKLRLYSSFYRHCDSPK